MCMMGGQGGAQGQQMMSALQGAMKGGGNPIADAQGAGQHSDHLKKTAAQVPTALTKGGPGLLAAKGR